MRVWLPYVFGGSGSDVFTQNLATALRRLGHEVIETRFSHSWQYFPGPMRYFTPPKDLDVTVCNSWNGFAFKRSAYRLVVVEHHFKTLIPDESGSLRRWRIKKQGESSLSFFESS